MLNTVVQMSAESAEHEVSMGLAAGVGLGALAILLVLLAALMFFGAGREHS
ncbi:hypothetical protein [Nocardioides insulae]|uniref:hypothetical protein n=1 Tax=Nocardioides insulae TaxID=394734 RepID=UPI0004252A1E|nr:hypothetical protein [Nocardioides insulae]